MNSLIVCDSQYGNTEKLANAVLEVLKTAGAAQLQRAATARVSDLKGVDLLILASATVQWNALPAMQAFIAKLSKDDLKHKKVATFDTIVHGPKFITQSAAEKMGRVLQGLGVELVVPYQNFHVAGREGPLDKGEEAKAKAWAKELLAKVKG